MKNIAFIVARYEGMDVKRSVLQIDYALCNGCGQCVSGCTEGALEVVGDKVRLVSEARCDGLGACLGTCPSGALRIVEREVSAFLKDVAQEYTDSSVSLDSASKAGLQTEHQQQWPVKLRLVSANAPFFTGRPLVVMADCVPLVLSSFASHIEGKAVVIGCPKFDDVNEYAAKLGEIVKSNNLRDVALIQMEVPCCSGLSWALNRALDVSGVKASVRRYIVSLSGQLLEAKA